MRTGAGRFAELSSSCLCGPDRLIESVTYDSRQVTENTLFVPLLGARVDGYDFISEAVMKGASAVLADRPLSSSVLSLCRKKRIAVLRCEDSLKAIARFSSLFILDNRHFTSVAVTGSCGKTTTKEMIKAALSSRFNVASTPGNLNSTIGLPLALLSLDEMAQWAVFEFGVDHRGEMDRLVSVFPPEYAVITNIGISHLEAFGSRDMIAREKGKIILPQTKAFVSAGCDYQSYFKSLSDNVTAVENPFRKVRPLGLDGYELTLGKERFLLSGIGEHSIIDASFTVAVAREAGLDDASIAQGLSSYTPLSGRGRIVRTGNLTVIEDCYNASLDSVSDAIKAISSIRWKGGKLIVLGDMRELGCESRKAHESVGMKLSRLKCSHIFLYGNEMEAAYRVLYDRGMKDSVTYTRDFDVLSSSFSRQLKAGDLVLLKGSRAMAMERLLDTVKEAG